MGLLKDMAQEIISASAGLEGRVAAETVVALGDWRLHCCRHQYTVRWSQDENPHLSGSRRTARGAQ